MAHYCMHLNFCTTLKLVSRVPNGRLSSRLHNLSGGHEECESTDSEVIECVVIFDLKHIVLQTVVFVTFSFFYIFFL